MELKTILSTIRNALRPPEAVSVNDRHYLIDSTYREVSPLRARCRAFLNHDGTRPIKVASIHSMLDLLLVYPHDSPFVEVVMSPDITTAMLDGLTFTEHRDVGDIIVMPYYTEMHPMNGRRSIPEFLAILDQHEEHIHDSENVCAAFRTLRFADSSEMTVAKKGAFLELTTASKKGVEGHTLLIPGKITIDLPTGASDIVVPNDFLITIDTGAQTVAIEKRLRDGSREAFMVQARTIIEEKLTAAKINHVVIEG